MVIKEIWPDIIRVVCLIRSSLLFEVRCRALPVMWVGKRKMS